MRAALMVLCLSCAALPAAAATEPRFILRMATVAPEGSGWAQLMRRLSSEVLRATRGEVLIRWYWGGVAGDEQMVLRRIEKGQLDGGGLSIACMALSPATRVLELAGLIDGADEAEEVARKLY